jgi:hypothetical protein
MLQRQGLVALASVLIISAGVWLILAGQAALHVNQAFLSDSYTKGESVFLLAQGCLDLSWRSILLNPEYKGQNLSQLDQSCIIKVVKTQDYYQVDVEAQHGNYYKKIMAAASLVDGKLFLDYWRQAE